MTFQAPSERKTTREGNSSRMTRSVLDWVRALLL